MFDTLVEVTSSDPNLIGSKIGQFAKKLLKAGYKPDDVRAFGKWWNDDQYRSNSGPPTPEAVLSRIGAAVPKARQTKPAHPRVVTWREVKQSLSNTDAWLHDDNEYEDRQGNRMPMRLLGLAAIAEDAAEVF